ncbi:MAG: RecQ family ATP-dependent DNA helicase [Ignavibacteriales bacterium]|nr:RecQ family ATP-dependent DNA helicase [Ignavibacteriales bacterium]
MREQALQYLRTALQNSDAEFRPGQWQCIDGVMKNQRQLVVQKTGWGKSMVYFLGTRLLRDQGKGLTLLVSPLLSLMRNQIVAAGRIGIKAATINSGNPDEWRGIEARLLAGQVDVLLISPERLANEQFRERVLQNVANRVGLFVVDEAHCISDWGHDFRPDYRRILRIVQALPKNVPVLATTATANNRVVRDVAAQLGALNVSRGPLVRESLALQNIWLSSPAERMAWLAEHLNDLPGSGIIYTLTIRDCERVTEWLRLKGHNVQAYHSKVDEVDEDNDRQNAVNRREQLEDFLLNNQVKALVSTVALGMGFDKPDLGFVIHFQRPGSVVHYYQQVGRAGRAVDHAFGIMLSGEEDEEITDYFIRSAFPPQAHIDTILRALNSAPRGLSVPALEKQINLNRGSIEKVLKILATEDQSPVAKIDTAWYATPVRYQTDQERIRQLVAIRQAEQAQMIEYLGTHDCLMHFLGRALDDPEAGACGKCANCRAAAVVPISVNPAITNEAAVFLKRNFQPIEPRKRWPAKDIFIHYPIRGLTIDENLRASEGRALSLWGDAGWGQLVRQGKNSTGGFPDELVHGCVEMLTAWKPAPRPSWVTCIPSLTHPNLVPDFARRLADRLSLPFVPCIRKVKQTEQQKNMQNSYQQVKNLDGVFHVDAAALQRGPVLLIDDMVDSRWTVTVATALLRHAGCAAVFPLALALNSQGND